MKVELNITGIPLCRSKGGTCRHNKKIQLKGKENGSVVQQKFCNRCHKSLEDGLLKVTFAM